MREIVDSLGRAWVLRFMLLLVLMAPGLGAAGSSDVKRLEPSEELNA